MSLKGIFAGIGAVAVLYVAVSLFWMAADVGAQKATGLAAAQGQALELLLHPAFLLASVVVFITAAYWANK